MLLALWAAFPLTSWTNVTPPPPNHILPDGGSSGHPMDYWQVHEYPMGSLYEYLEAREEHLKRRNRKKKKVRAWELPYEEPVVQSAPYKEVVEEPKPVVARLPEKIPAIPTTKMFAMHLQKIEDAQQAMQKLEARVAQHEQQMDDEALELLLLS